MMSPERWQEIKEVLHAALELEPEQRSAYLDRACSTDHSLRREVELLLSSSDDVRSSFLNSGVARVTLTEGTRLGDYEVQSLLGSGGMGEVYRARDPRLGRDVAIKVLPPFFASDRVRLRRFEQEARAAAALNHPNILAVHQMGTYEGSPYLVSELLEGETLRARVKRGPLPVHQAVDYALQIARGLAAAHEKGVVHRDLKPENLFVTKDGQIKILDFGLAKQTRAESGVEATGGSLGTEPGVVLGTVGYMSPEQVRGQATDSRSDIFALGAILYEMLSGQRAFQGDSPADIMSAILSRYPDSLSASHRMIPPALERVVQRCLEKTPTERFQSARDVVSSLEAISYTAAQAATMAIAQPRRGLSRKALWVTISLVAALVAGTLYYRSGSAKPLTERDTIVLGDFSNSTGDRVFDGTLRQGLSVELEQSPFLKLASEEQIHQTLRMMGQKTDAQLTPEIAREVCQRTDSAATLGGSIARIGTRYDLILRAVDCASGDLLASAEARAKDKSDVLDALGKVASEMRRKLGESLSTVQKYSTPLVQATTPSLEALRVYSLGLKTLEQTGDFAASLSFFQRATELDPNFAMAYWTMSDALNTLGETASAAENMRRAFELRGRVSEREKLVIEGAYYLYQTGDLMKARRSFDLVTKIYPRDDYAHNVLGFISSILGQYEAGLREYREALRLAPFRSFLHRYVVLTYLLSDRVEDAAAAAEEAHTKGLDSNLTGVLYGIAFYRGDPAEMARQVASVTGRPGDEDLLLALDADTAAYFGHLGKARELTRGAADSAERAGEKETAAGYYAASALREALFGNTYKARQLATTARRRSTGRDMDYAIALALAYAGDTNLAQALADDLDSKFPEDTVVRFNYLPALRAKLALRHSNPKQALDILEVAAPYELGLPALSFYNWPNLYPVYARGEAYLAAHQGGEAATEFQKILDHRGIVLNEPIGALAHLQLGRAYAISGDTAKARAAYQEFLTLWKDADPDIPILQQAKAEYAKLP